MQFTIINDDKLSFNFQYILGNKMIWSYVKKFIHLNNSKLYEEIKDLEFMIKNEYYPLLADKIKNNYPLNNILDVGYYLFSWVLHTKDMVTIRKFFQTYNKEILFGNTSLSITSFLSYRCKEKTPYLKEDLKPIMEEVLDLIETYTYFDTQKIWGEFLCFLHPVIDIDLVDKIFSKKIKTQFTHIIAKLMGNGNLEMFKFLIEQVPTKYQIQIKVLAKIGEKLIDNKESLIIYCFYQYIGDCKEVEFVDYLISLNSEITKTITYKMILSANNKPMMKKLIEVYRNSNNIDKSLTDVEAIMPIVENTNLYQCFNTIYQWDQEKLEMVLELVKHIKISDKSFEHLYCSYFIKKKILHALKMPIKLKFYKDSIKGFNTDVNDFTEALHSNVTPPSISFLKRAIKFQVPLPIMEVIIKRIHSLQKSNKPYLVLESNVEQSIASLLIQKCKSSIDIFTFVYGYLNPNIDYTHLLKKSAFKQILFLINNNFKTVHDFYDGIPSNYPKRLMMNSALSNNFELFKFVYENISKLDGIKSRWTKSPVYAIDMTTNRKIIEYLLLAGHSYTYLIPTILREKRYAIFKTVYNILGPNPFTSNLVMGAFNETPNPYVTKRDTGFIEMVKFIHQNEDLKPLLSVLQNPLTSSYNMKCTIAFKYFVSEIILSKMGPFNEFIDILNRVKGYFNQFSSGHLQLYMFTLLCQQLKNHSSFNFNEILKSISGPQFFYYPHVIRWLIDQFGNKLRNLIDWKKIETTFKRNENNLQSIEILCDYLYRDSWRKSFQKIDKLLSPNLVEISDYMLLILVDESLNKFKSFNFSQYNFNIPISGYSFYSFNAIYFKKIDNKVE